MERIGASVAYLGCWGVLLSTHVIAGDLERWKVAVLLVVLTHPPLGYAFGTARGLLPYLVLVGWSLVPGAVVSGTPDDLAPDGFATGVGMALVALSPLVALLIGLGVAVRRVGRGRVGGPNSHSTDL